MNLKWSLSFKNNSSCLVRVVVYYMMEQLYQLINMLLFSMHSTFKHIHCHRNHSCPIYHLVNDGAEYQPRVFHTCRSTLVDFFLLLSTLTRTNIMQRVTTNSLKLFSRATTISARQLRCQLHTVAASVSLYAKVKTIFVTQPWCSNGKQLLVWQYGQ